MLNKLVELTLVNLYGSLYGNKKISVRRRKMVTKEFGTGSNNG